MGKYIVIALTLTHRIVKKVPKLVRESDKFSIAFTCSAVCAVCVGRRRGGGGGGGGEGGGGGVGGGGGGGVGEGGAVEFSV